MSDGRSGRVTIPPSTEKTVIIDNLTGGKVALYRFFNSGKTGAKVEILEKSGTSVKVLGELDWKDSLDVPVSNKAIAVRSGAVEAEIVYDYLGMA